MDVDTHEVVSYELVFNNEQDVDNASFCHQTFNRSSERWHKSKLMHHLWIPLSNQFCLQLTEAGL